MLLQAFQTFGVNFRQLSRRTGASYTSLQTVYEKGWPEVPGCPPIRQALMDSEILARASRATGIDPVKAQLQADFLKYWEATGKLSKEALDEFKQRMEEAQKAEARATEMHKEAISKLKEVEETAKRTLADAETAAQARVELGLAQAEAEGKRRLAEFLERAKVDAAETMADEANGAKFQRKAAMGAAAVAALSLRDAAWLAGTLNEKLKKGIDKLSPLQHAQLLQIMARTAVEAGKAVETALQSERLRVGQPTQIIGTQTLEKSFEEREIKLRAVQRSMEKERARLSVVPNPPQQQSEDDDAQRTAS